MSVPKPKKPLSGDCATISNNTLYVYSGDSFQSLPLKKNATWAEETVGQSVTNPACANAASTGDDADAALYVVGGETSDGNYRGLQRFSFQNQSWETLSPLADVLQTRTNHSVTYLQDSQSILVYGGSTTDAPSLLSSQTFLISTQPPYNIRSFTSNAPPTNNAILLPWNSSHAVMVGGETTTTSVWLFGPNDGWRQLPTNLSAPIQPASRAVLVDGTDGSKVLELFELDVSPNMAQNIVLLDANGQVAPTGQTVGNNTQSASGRRKRDLTLQNWPAYNATDAPTSIRSDCSVSRTSEGLVVIAGGNDDHPIVMFNQQDNSWIDADTFFDTKQIQQPLQPSSTSASAPSPTSSSMSSPTPADSSSGLSAHDRTLRTLGIVLGVLCGVAVLFVLVLLFLRWRKNQIKKKNIAYLAEKDGADGPSADGNRLSFADRGASLSKEIGMPTNELSPPTKDRYATSNRSHSSLAIIAGKIGSKRNTGSNHYPKDSFESTTHLVKDKNGNPMPGESHEMMDIGDKIPPQNSSNLAVPGAAVHGSSLEKGPRGNRSSGWSRYFATSSPTGPNGLSHLPSVYGKPEGLNSEGLQSSNDRPVSQAARISTSGLTALPAINANETMDGQRLSHVTQHSPAFFDSRDEVALRGGSLDIADGQQGVIVDPRKSQPDSISSYDNNRSTMSSSIASEFYNESGHTPWTPMSGTRELERPPSSSYAGSMSERERRPSRGKSAGFFPGSGTNYRIPKVKLGFNAGPTSEWALPKMPAAKLEGRDSTASDVTVFPSAEDIETTPKKATDLSPTAAPGASGQSQEQSKGTQDMSWLDLGLSKTRS